MPATRSLTGSKLTSVTLSTEALASMGKLVRAMAEIEDRITLWICRLSMPNIRPAST